MRASHHVRHASASFLAIVCALVFVFAGCSHDDTQIGDIETLYLIDESFTPYFMVMFETKWSKSDSFTVSASCGQVEWSGSCLRIEKDSKTYDCSRPMLIPFNDSSPHEVRLDIGYNNNKKSRVITIANPLRLFLPDSAFDSTTIEDFHDVDDRLEEMEEAVSGDAHEDGGEDEAVTDGSVADESDADEDAGSPARIAVKTDSLSEYRDEIRRAALSASSIGDITATRTSASRIEISFGSFDASTEMFYALQKSDSEISSSSRITSKTTRVNVTSSFRRLILAERADKVSLGDRLYFVRMMEFD